MKKKERIKMMCKIAADTNSSTSSCSNSTYHIPVYKASIEDLTSEDYLSVAVDAADRVLITATDDYIWLSDFSIPPQQTDIWNPDDMKPMIQYWVRENNDSPPVPVYSIEHPGPLIEKSQETFFNGPFSIAVRLSFWKCSQIYLIS
jgi:hypothetical protein